jgi:hypothetical protein
MSSGTEPARLGSMAGYHKVGDHVEVIETPQTKDAGQVGRRGVVLEVRRYPDESYTYGLGFMVDGEVGGLYSSDWLKARGEHSALDGLRGLRRPTVKHSTRVSVTGDSRASGSRSWRA